MTETHEYVGINKTNEQGRRTNKKHKRGRPTKWGVRDGTSYGIK